MMTPGEMILARAKHIKCSFCNAHSDWPCMRPDGEPYSNADYVHSARWLMARLQLRNEGALGGEGYNP